MNRSRMLTHEARVLWPRLAVALAALTPLAIPVAPVASAPALSASGAVYAWGTNNYGQLGDGTQSAQYDNPVQVTGLTDIVAVAAGDGHSLALGADGVVWAWGRNDLGQIGAASPADSVSPVKVSGLPRITAVATGRWHSLALGADGGVWAWGSDRCGQLGDGKAPGSPPAVAGDCNKVTGAGSFSSTPVQVAKLSGVRAIGAGESHSLAVKQDGTVWAWGWNGESELGEPGRGPSGRMVEASPVQVTGITGAVAARGGDHHSVALKSDGTVWGWGDAVCCGVASTSSSGQGSTTSSPTQVKSLSGIVALRVDHDSSYVIDSRGSIWDWGNNEYGQLGNGKASPVSGGCHQGCTEGLVLTPAQCACPFKATALGGGWFNSFAIAQDGTIWQWGSTQGGRPGFYVATPAPVPGLSGVVAVSSGGFGHILVVAPPTGPNAPDASSAEPEGATPPASPGAPDAARTQPEDAAPAEDDSGT